jgi:hypothetical protein
MGGATRPGDCPADAAAEPVEPVEPAESANGASDGSVRPENPVPVAWVPGAAS